MGADCCTATDTETVPGRSSKQLYSVTKNEEKRTMTLWQSVRPDLTRTEIAQNDDTEINADFKDKSRRSQSTPFVRSKAEV